MQRARAVLKNGTPEGIEAVERGEVTVKEAARAARKIRKRGKPADKAPATPTSSHNGPKINVPNGETPESMARELLQLRAGGLSLAKCERRFGILQSTLSKMCDIVTISDHAGLPTAEAELAHAALKLMNNSRQVVDAWPLVKPLAARLWGDPPRGRSRQRAEQSHLDGFWRAYGVLIQACTNAGSMEVPVLPKDRLDGIDAELHGAIRAVTKLRRRIKELHQ